VIPPVLLDVSAWTRLKHPALSAERKEELVEAAESLRFRACLPFLLEAGFTARDALDHRRMMASLRALPRVEMDPARRHAPSRHNASSRPSVTIAFPRRTSS
jgi:hypothetical protein